MEFPDTLKSTIGHKAIKYIHGLIILVIPLTSCIEGMLLAYPGFARVLFMPCMQVSLLEREKERQRSEEKGLTAAAITAAGEPAAATAHIGSAAVQEDEFGK